VRDEALRGACFSRLAILEAQFGEELPYRGCLDQGFPFRGDRVPFLSPQKGIFRARRQSGPAALSITTSFSGGPYADIETEEVFVYSYREGSIEQSDNVALRQAHDLGVPLVCFIASRPGWYEAIYPCYIRTDNPAGRVVVVDKGRMRGDYEEPEPAQIEDPLERRYVNREVRVRVHQRRFRWRVIPAYRNRCAMCRLKEVSLLDAAHIIADADVRGEPAVSNGVSLCSMHHRTFDQDLVGVTPDYLIRVSPRLLDEDDGPMLTLLQDAHDQQLLVCRSVPLRPDRERLAIRYERFLEHAAG
jgi:putative restriction endonuclease